MRRPWPASSPGIPGPRVASRDAGQDRPRSARLYRPHYPPRGRGYLARTCGYVPAQTCCVTRVKHLCNWTEIATPLGSRNSRRRNQDPHSSSITCSASSTLQLLKFERVVHLRACKARNHMACQGTIHLTGGHMFQGADDLLAYVKDEGVEFIDIRFCDLPGTMQHFTVPVGTFGPEYFE